MTTKEEIQEQQEKEQREEELRGYLESLQRVREELETATTQYDAQRAKFEQETAEISSKVTRLRTAAKELEESVRVVTMDMHEAGQDLPYGVGVRASLVLHYDAAQAKDWAMLRNFREMLTLDTKKFEKVAKALDLPWVEEHRVEKASVPKKIDLAEPVE